MALCGKGYKSNLASQRGTTLMPARCSAHQFSPSQVFQEMSGTIKINFHIETH